jgi:hypothetical protein
MDHDHETGRFRAIVCRSCNTNDSYIKYPNGYTNEDLKKKQKDYRDNHKTTCICGVSISKYYKSDHLKTQRHLNNMDKYMNNVD